MPENNDDAHLSTQNLGENLWHLKAHLIAFSLVFNILETWRRRTLMLNPGIVQFLKNIIERFLNNREICRRGPN